MVKPIPLHHSPHTLSSFQESVHLRDTENIQTKTAVPETTHTLKAELSNQYNNEHSLVPSQAVPSTNQDPQPGSLEKALQQLNEKMQPWATGIKFEIDSELDRLVVSIIDNHSGEVLRTIPSETLLQIAKMITTFQGQNIDTKV